MAVKEQKKGGNVAMEVSESEEGIDAKVKNLGILYEALETSTAEVVKFKKILKKKTDESHDDVEKLIAKILEHGRDFEGLGGFADKLIDAKLSWLFKKIAWKPGKVVKNFGYIGYGDMLLRYRDLKRNLEKQKMMHERMMSAQVALPQEYRNLRQISEKLDELRYRKNLLMVANEIASRTVPGEHYSLFCNIPAILCGIIFLPETSDYYATVLLRICKQLLVVSEVLQYEQDKNNQPIVTMSKVLSHPSINSAVPSLFIPVADGNGEVRAPEDHSPLIARDSSHCLMVAENGEVIAPTDLFLPIAKDSSMTLNSNDPPKPLTSTEVEESYRGNVRMSKKENVELNRK